MSNVKAFLENHPALTSHDRKVVRNSRTACFEKFLETGKSCTKEEFAGEYAFYHDCVGEKGVKFYFAEAERLYEMNELAKAELVKEGHSKAEVDAKYPVERIFKYTPI